MEEGGGLKNGRSVWSSRSVDEEVSEDFSKDVLVEGEEGSRSGHDWRRWFLDGKKEGREEAKGKKRDGRRKRTRDFVELTLLDLKRAPSLLPFLHESTSNSSQYLLRSRHVYQRELSSSYLLDDALRVD